MIALASPRARAILGALGAVVPILIGYAASDDATMHASSPFAVMAGYGIRVVILVAAGALAAVLHERVTTAFTLFELGMIVPALVIVLIGSSVATERTAPARALETAAQQGSTIESFANRAESTREQLWRGLSGTGAQARWFVVLDNAPRAEQDARSIVHELMLRYGVSARIYGAGGPKQGQWTIVLGDWMTERSAYELVHALNASGVAAFAWYLPPS